MTGQVIELIANVLALYAALGLMGIGFALMLAGREGAHRLARALYLAPLVWAGRRIAMLITAAGTGLAGFVMQWIVRPFMAELAFWLRWLVGGR